MFFIIIIIIIIVEFPRLNILMKGVGNLLSQLHQTCTPPPFQKSLLYPKYAHLVYLIDHKVSINKDIFLNSFPFHIATQTGLCFLVCMKKKTSSIVGNFDL